MPKEDAIEIDGTVVEILANRVVRVELANGHRLLAHPSAGLRHQFMPLASGERVRVAMSPYDLSKGCILERQREATI